MSPDSLKYRSLGSEAAKSGNRELWDGFKAFLGGLPEFQQGENLIVARPRSETPELVTSFQAPNGANYKIIEKESWEVTCQREDVSGTIEEVSINLVNPQADISGKGRLLLERLKTDFQGK